MKGEVNELVDYVRTFYQNAPVLISPARLYEAMITPLGEILESFTNALRLKRISIATSFCYHTPMPDLTSKAHTISDIKLTAINNLTIGYIVTNTEHEVLIINYAARQLLAAKNNITSLEEVVTRLPERIALFDHVKYCSVEHKSCSFREEQLGDRKVRVFLSPIFSNNELAGNLLTLEDITEQVNKEHAREQFLTFLVHELRTPLTAIRGYSSLIQDDYKELLKDPSLNKMVNRISISTENLLGIVNQFLDMSRLEENRIEYDLQAFDAVKVVEETITSLQVIAQNRDLTLVLATPPKPAIQVVGDPARIKQVLTNLIGNGLKFTEKGAVTVSLRDNGKNQLEVLVEDTGPGIPEESRAGLFQKYFQAANNKYRHDSAKSTGLGLYVTKLMVEGMGGQISLAPQIPGKGATFIFSISLATKERLKLLEKQQYDAKQGVQHAPALEHQSTLLAI